MAIVKSLMILLRGNTGRLKNDFRPAKKALTDLRTQATSVFKGVAFRITGIAGAVVGVTSLATAMVKLNSQFNRVDEIAKTADKIGTTVGEMQALALAAKLAGSDLGSVERSMIRFSQTLGKAISGDATSVKALENIGLSIESFEGLGATESFGLVSDAINKLGSQAEQTAATMEIFGRGGTEIFNLIKGGSEAINAATEDIQSFGGELSRIDAAKVEMANDAWTRMQALIDGLFQRLAVSVAPAFTALIETIFELTRSTSGFGDMGVFVLESITAGVEIVSRSFSFMAGIVRSVQSVFATLLSFVLDGLAKIEMALVAFGGQSFNFGIAALSQVADSAAQELANLANQNFAEAFGDNTFLNTFRSKLGEIESRAAQIASNVEGKIFAAPITPEIQVDQKKLQANVNLASAERGSQEAFATIFGGAKPMDEVVAAQQEGNGILEQIKNSLVRQNRPQLAVEGDLL